MLEINQTRFLTASTPIPCLFLLRLPRLRLLPRSRLLRRRLLLLPFLLSLPPPSSQQHFRRIRIATAGFPTSTSGAFTPNTVLSSCAFQNNTHPYFKHRATSMLPSPNISFQFPNSTRETEWQTPNRSHE